MASSVPRDLTFCTSVVHRFLRILHDGSSRPGDSKCSAEGYRSFFARDPLYTQAGTGTSEVIHSGSRSPYS